MVLVLSRGGFCPKDRRQAERLLELLVKWRSAIAGLSRSVPTTSLRRMNIAPGSALTGPSSQTHGVLSKRDLDIAEYTDPVHDPMNIQEVAKARVPEGVVAGGDEIKRPLPGE